MVKPSRQYNPLCITVKPGVGNIRPADQIWPAMQQILARDVIFAKNQLMQKKQV